MCTREGRTQLAGDAPVPRPYLTWSRDNYHVQHVPTDGSVWGMTRSYRQTRQLCPETAFSLVPPSASPLPPLGNLDGVNHRQKWTFPSMVLCGQRPWGRSAWLPDNLACLGWPPRFHVTCYASGGGVTATDVGVEFHIGCSPHVSTW